MSANDIGHLTLTDEEINELIRKIELDYTTVRPYSGNYWDWDYDDWDSGSDVKEPTRGCPHVWVPSLLLTTTVYDCKLCGMKKEDYDNLQNNKPIK